MLPVEQPFKTYTGLDGKPLENGFVYFGRPNENPITAPVTVYWDAAGTIPAAQPLRTVGGYIMRAGTPANVFFDGAYSELVQDSKKRQVFYARTSEEFSLASAVSAFLKNLAVGAGSSLIGFLLPGVGAKARTVQDKLQEFVSVLDFMTQAQIADVRSGAGLLDLTAPIQAAVDHVYVNNLGTVHFPPGVYAFTTIVRNWDVVRSMDITGAGKRATVFKKFGSSTSPLFDWSANDDILETYSNFEDFAIRGNAKMHHGIRVTKCARFCAKELDIGGCDRAIDNQGALVWVGYGLSLQGNKFGLYTTRAATTTGGWVYPNAITLRDSQVCFNTSYGVYARHANGMRLRDVDIESNGTAGDQDTGGVIFAETNLEFGVGSLSVSGSWFEGNKGWALTVDDANTATSVSIVDTQLIGSEAGRVCRVMSARSCRLGSVMALSPADTVTVAASHSVIENSTISNLLDTSVRKTWLNVVTASVSVENGGGFCNGLEVSGGKALKLTWSAGTGVYSITPDTVSGTADYGTPSGLHRFSNQIGIYSAVDLDDAKSQALFVDEADNKLKFKDINGVINLLY